MTREDLEQLGKLIKPLQDGQERLEKDIKGVKTGVSTIKQNTQRLDQGQAQIITAVETLEAGQKDLRENVTAIRDEQATKAGIQDLKAEVVRKIKQHDKRIDELEEKAGVSNPYKN